MCVCVSFGFSLFDFSTTKYERTFSRLHVLSFFEISWDSGLLTLVSKKKSKHIGVASEDGRTLTKCFVLDLFRDSRGDISNSRRAGEGEGERCTRCLSEYGWSTDAMADKTSITSYIVRHFHSRFACGKILNRTSDSFWFILESILNQWVQYTISLTLPGRTLNHL